MAQRPPALDRRAVMLSRGLPLLAYLILIFVVSAQPHLKAPFDFPNSDKLWHMAEYGGLGALVTRLLRSLNDWRLRPGLIALAVLLCSANGAADERFQSTVPGRESSVYDWAADTVGATLGALAYARIVRNRAGEATWL